MQALESRMRQQIQTSPNMPLLKTLPGVGDISATVIKREVGSIDRFQLAEKLAGNGGITPKVKAALPRGLGQGGGKIPYGPVRQPARRQTGRANHHPKWACAEAAKIIAINRAKAGWKRQHVSRLYDRIKKGKVLPSQLVRWPGLSRRRLLGS